MPFTIGEIFESLKYLYRISVQSIGRIVLKLVKQLLKYFHMKVKYIVLLFKELISVDKGDSDTFDFGYYGRTRQMNVMIQNIVVR